jgi:hypothetical protein
MSNHTPGPWAVGQIVNNFVQIVAPEYRTLTDADHVVCELREWRQPRCDDNAKLIAAAPELLAACRMALDYFNETRNGRDWRDNGGEEPRVLATAIAKAEGRGE